MSIRFYISRPRKTQQDKPISSRISRLLPITVLPVRILLLTFLGHRCGLVFGHGRQLGSTVSSASLADDIVALLALPSARRGAFDNGAGGRDRGGYCDNGSHMLLGTSGDDLNRSSGLGLSDLGSRFLCRRLGLVLALGIIPAKVFFFLGLSGY